MALSIDKETKDAYVPICNKLQYLAYLLLNSLIAGPWYIRGWCLMLERRYGFHAGAWMGKALF